MRTTVPRLVAVTFIGAGLVSACSGGPGTDHAASASTGSASTGSASKGSATSTDRATAKGGKTGSAVGARADLSEFSCDAASTGVWSARGTLHNATPAAVKYSVLVSVASTKTSTVVGDATKTVTLDPGKSEQFTLDKVAVQKGGAVACTAHVVRAAAS
jgi:hypothetical protein